MRESPRRLKSWQGWLLLAFAAALAPLLFVAYIDQGPEEGLGAPDMQNRSSDALRQSSAAERKAALEAALRETGKACDRVDRTFFQGQDSEGTAYWNVVCDEGEALSLQFSADEHNRVRVVECNLLEHTGRPCFTAFNHRR